MFLLIFAVLTVLLDNYHKINALDVTNLSSISISRLISDFLPNTTKIYTEIEYETVYPTTTSKSKSSSDNFLWLPYDLVYNNSFEQGLLAEGQYKSYHKIKTKLENNEILYIVTIGGSITFGHQCNNCPLIPLPWPDYIQYIFQNLGYNHVQVINLSRRAAGSQEWVDRIMEWRDDMKHIIHTSDLIILETCVNDIHELVQRHQNRYGSEDTDVIAQNTEVLIRILLSLSQNPAILYIEASGRGNNYNVEPTTAVASHGKVIRPYQLSQFSMMHAFSTIHNINLKQLWFNSIYIADKFGHLSEFGHHFMAIYIIKLISTFCYHYHSISSVQYPNLRSNLDYYRENPIFVSRNVSLLYEKGSPFFLNFGHFSPYVKLGRGIFRERFVENNYFVNEEDIKGKPGLIGYNISASVKIRVFPFELEKHLRFGLLKLEYLTSYENMGTMNITLIHMDLCTTPLVLTNITIDTLINNRISISKTIDISFEKKDFWLARDCLDIRVTVIDSLPLHRESNKIKLLGMHLY